MPADKYGKSLYKAGTMKSEKAAIANRDPARKAAAEKLLAREGTTSPAGGRAVKMPAKTAMPKPSKQPVVRTTITFKPTPMNTKKR